MQISRTRLEAKYLESDSKNLQEIQKEVIYKLLYDKEGNKGRLQKKNNI